MVDPRGVKATAKAALPEIQRELIEEEPVKKAERTLIPGVKPPAKRPAPEPSAAMPASNATTASGEPLDQKALEREARVLEFLSTIPRVT